MQTLTLRPFLDVYRLVLRLEETANPEVIEEISKDGLEVGFEKFKTHCGTISADLFSLAQELEPDPGIDAEEETKFGSFDLEEERNAFREFQQEMEELLVRWDDSDFNPLKDMEEFFKTVLARIQSFRSYLEEKVGKRILFQPIDEELLIEFLTPAKVLNHFQKIETWLPRITKTLLEDSCRSLAYGITTASISLSLQAVEATLRYYCYRQGLCNPKCTWEKLLSALGQDRMPGDLPSNFQRLSDLGQEYRNITLHGRTQFEKWNFPKAIDLIDRCWEMIRILSPSDDDFLQIQLAVPYDLNLDIAFATYIYKWNEELREVDIENIRFGGATSGKMRDVFHRRPNIRVVDNCIYKGTIVHLKLQEQSLKRFKKICKFIDEQKNGQLKKRFNLSYPNMDDLDLEDIMDLIKLQFQNSEQKGKLLLEEMWGVFETLALQELSPRGPNLVTSLGIQSHYDANISTLINERRNLRS